MTDPRVKRLAPFGAAILAMILALVIPVPHEKLSQLASTPAAPAAAPTTATTTVAVPNVPPRTGGGSGSGTPPPATTSGPPATPAPNPPLASPPPAIVPGEDPPAPSPCNAQAALDGIDKALKSADTLTGGVVPANNLSTLIAIAAKCSDNDPTLTLVGLLNELGQGLPDLGLPGLPILPPLTLPQPLLDLLKPLGVFTEPVCQQLGTAGTLLLVTAGSYPEPLASTMSNLAFEALGPCTQLHPPQ